MRADETPPFVVDALHISTLAGFPHEAFAVRSSTLGFTGAIYLTSLRKPPTQAPSTTGDVLVDSHNSDMSHGASRHVSEQEAIDTLSSR